MLTQEQAKELLRALQELPADKVTEVYDYVTFLHERYSDKPSVDTSETWSDEDIKDLIAASLDYASKTM